MRPDDKTDMGGPNKGFQTTDWGDVEHARTLHEGRRREALGELIDRYWKPIYCYIRRKGYADADAKDLTQGFFQEVVLDRDLFQQADRSKGRLRNLLLTALKRHVASEYRARVAKKRQPVPGKDLIHLDDMEPHEMPQAPHDGTPDEVFHYSWAAELLEQTLAAVERQCHEAGQEAHWALFKARVLEPIIEDKEPPPLDGLCAQYGVADAAKASNMIVTVKRTFEKVLKNQVRAFVDSDADVDEEIYDLVRILSKGGAGSGGALRIP